MGIVVVPEPGREVVLIKLHDGHTGTAHMKAIARMYVRWPVINTEVEKLVRGCQECQQI